MTDYRRQQPKGNDSVATKPELWRPLARAVGGFDLDPAAGAEPEPIADTTYTVEDDGLTEPWFGTVWLNPPFSEKIVWYRKLVDQVNAGNVDRAVAVAPVDTSTEWFQKWFSTADVIAFLDGRDQFVRNPGNGGNSPSFSSMIGVWRPTDEVREVLQRKGVVCTVERDGEQQPLTAF